MLKVWGVKTFGTRASSRCACGEGEVPTQTNLSRTQQSFLIVLKQAISDPELLICDVRIPTFFQSHERK